MARTQWTTTTIRAEDLKPGDVVAWGHSPVHPWRRVESVRPSGDHDPEEVLVGFTGVGGVLRWRRYHLVEIQVEDRR